MKNINRHGLVLSGLEELRELVSNTDFRDTATEHIQVFYSKETKNVWGIRGSLGFSTEYPDDDIIKVSIIRRKKSIQDLADDVYKAILTEEAKKQYSDEIGILYDCDIYRDKDGFVKVLEQDDTTKGLQLIAKVRSGKVELVS